MLELSKRTLVLDQFGDKYSLPQGSGKTLRVVRYKRLNNPTEPLAELIPPDALALSTENVDVTVEQWGIVSLLSDVAQVTTEHPALNIAIERTSRSMSEVVEREIAGVLLGGTKVTYGTAASSRAGLDGSKVLTSADIFGATSSLRWAGAMPYEGDLFVAVIPPQVEMDMMSDSTFKDAASRSQVARLNVGEIAVWGGIKFMRSNALPVYKGVGAPGTQDTEVSGYSNETGAGAGIGGSKVTVIARDVQSGYERKISQEKAVGAGKDTADVTTPTSTNYVYDIYNTNVSGTGYKLIFKGVAANTLKTLTATTYTNGVSKTPTAAPASGKTVFIGWVFGKSAYGVVELSGMSMKNYITPDQASFSNPLVQGRKVGSKLMWKSFLLDNEFFRRLEMNSAFSADLPA